jgi:3-phenylpropionate/trans-cinnamate dioxygenase ferredoxin subunit
MAETEFIAVAKVEEIPDPGSLLVEVGERLVVLVHSAGRFYALDDVCTHDGGPLSDGPICDGAIVCPRHGARFDLASGAPLSMPATQPTDVHEVRVEGATILVRVHDR